MYSAQTRSFVGSNPTLSTSRPVALTHSPTPGSKKCGVLSKGFLASKSKPVYIPFRWRAVPFKSGEGNQVCSQTVHREREISPRYGRSLWVNLKPCRKRDEADNIRKRTGIIGSNPIVAAVLLFIIRFSIAIRWEGMGHTGRKQNPH